MKLVLLGAPGSGKGTQAVLLSARYHIPHISTGALLRDAIANKTELGTIANRYIHDGKLVPDEVMSDLVRDRLEEGDCERGYILDGFPRTVPQAQALESISRPEFVINIAVTVAVVIERLSGRRTCRSCGAVYHIKFTPSRDMETCDKCSAPLYLRTDDLPNAIIHRLEVYENQTRPLIEFYTTYGLSRDVPGEGAVDAVFARICEAIEQSGIAR